MREPRLTILPHQIHTKPARHEGENRIRPRGGDLRELGCKIKLRERHINLVYHFTLEAGFEAGHCITPGLVIRHHDENALIALVFADLADHGMHLVVIVRCREEEGIAAAPGKGGRPGIGADQEGIGFRHRANDGLQNIGEDNAHNEIAAVAFECGAHLRHRNIGLQFIINHHGFGGQATQPTIQMAQPHQEAIAQLRAQCRLRAGLHGNQADLHPAGGLRMQNGGRCQQPQGAAHGGTT